MKKITTLLLTTISSIMLAQVPNGCFTNWSGGINNSPTGWETSNIQVAGSATESFTAQSPCTTACALNSVVNGSVYYGGGIVTWNGHSPGFPNAGNPAALNGWYELTANGGDQLTIAVITHTAYNHTNAVGLETYTTSVGVYKQFSVCLILDSAVADSAAIYIDLYNSRGHDTTHAGSLATIDDLSFGSCIATGVEEVSNNNVTLEAAYPNPASTTCNIIFSLPCASTVNVAIYDLNGKKVLSPLENATLTDGRYKVPVDVTNLANGIYEYTVTVNGLPYTQKLVVAK